MRRFLGSQASGNHPASGPFIDALVESLKDSARQTLALHPDHVDFELLQFEVRQEVGLLRQFGENIKQLERQCEALYDAIHPTDVLRTIPGIGLTLAPLLVGVIADPKRFANERQIRGFCGLFPTIRSSGGVENPRQRITKSGSDRVKRALYLAADVARKIDPDLAAVYWRLMVHKGHHHKQAICAVATRLVNRIYRVLKTGQPYVLRNLDGQEITVEQGKCIVRENFQVPVQIRNSRRKRKTSTC